MADEDRHAHAGDGQPDRGVHDLVDLIPHLGFLIGIAVVAEGADEGDDVEGDLFGEEFRPGVAEAVDGLGLVPQLIHARLAGTRDRLIGRDHGPGDLRRVMQGLEGHDQLGGRAVGVGDDVLPRRQLDGVGVHLRHDQGHVRVHAEGRGVVDDDGAGLADLLGPGARGVAAGAHQHQVDGGEIEQFDVLAFDRPVAPGHFHALGLARGDGVHGVDGEFEFLEDVQHFPAHIAGGAHDGDFITHRCWSFGRPVLATRSLAA